MSDDIAVGIDLGTSYSAVATVIDGKPDVLTNEWGERTHASVVSFLEDGTVLVGNSAKRNIITNAENTVYSAKRLIGRFFFSDEVKKAQAVMPYRIVEGPNNSVRVQIGERVLAIPEVSALVLKEMKAIAETLAGPRGPPGGGHLPRLLQRQPAPGHQGRRPHRRARGAAHHQRAHRGGAGLRLREGHLPAHLRLRPGRRHLRRLHPGDRRDVFEVIATAGDTYLGGDDFDDRIMTWLAEDFLAKHGVDLRQNKFCLQMLKEAGEKAKIDVGRDGQAAIKVEGICQTPEGQVLDLEQVLGVDQFNRMVMDLVQRTFKVCDEALQSARMTAERHRRGHPGGRAHPASHRPAARSGTTSRRSRWPASTRTRWWPWAPPSRPRPC